MMTLMWVEYPSSIRGIHVSDLTILKEKLEQEVKYFYMKCKTGRFLVNDFPNSDFQNSLARILSDFVFDDRLFSRTKKFMMLLLHRIA